MSAVLTIADLLFLQANVIFGSNPPPGTVATSPVGLRNVNGVNNNITHQILTDQFGHLVNTDAFGVTDVPFIYFTPPVFISTNQFDSAPQADVLTFGQFVTANPSLSASFDAATIAFFNQSPALGGFGATFGTDYSQSAPGAAATALHNVIDPSPRIISNLVVDMNPATNPHVAANVIGNPADPALFIVPANSFMTFFGQFFDHGLDFIAKLRRPTRMPIPEPACRFFLSAPPESKPC